MLLQFSVENYRSIKEKAVLSLAASADSEHPNNYTVIGKHKCLKVASIYGANAAGKSNLFLALTAAIMTVRRSNNLQVGEPLRDIIPFKFDPQKANEPTSFEFIFEVHGKKYVYGFSATQKRIETEYLYYYKTIKATTIFERDIHADPEYHFTSSKLRTQLSPLTERNTENKLFLATATAWNCEETKEPLLWFFNEINTYSTDYKSLLEYTGRMFEQDADNSLREFTNKLLHEADINISDYVFEAKEIPKEMLILHAPPIIREMISASPENTGKEYHISTKHHIKSDTGEYSDYSLAMMEESKGTNNVFLLSPILKSAFETGETICIDEFDTSLHPMLVRYLVGLFNNPSVNKANAQLIISTHDMSLLSLDDLRRDQIYFIDKDQETGASELYSLDEFSPRKNEKIRKEYLLGRFGAVPNIEGGDFLW